MSFKITFSELKENGHFYPIKFTYSELSKVGVFSESIKLVPLFEQT